MPVRALNAHAILRTLDLMIDGPVKWGQPVRSRAPGIFVVEQPTPDALAMLEITAIRAWVDRVPSFQLDGKRPEPAAVADRLRSFWLPGQHILYVGRSTKSLGARVAALYGTPLGDRRPHPGGHWLKTLKGVEGLRIWWAETNAPEEYEDAIATAIAETVTPEERKALPDQSLIMPWANLESVGGEKRVTGLTGTLLDPDAAPVAKPGAKPATSTTKASATRTTAARSTSASRTTTTRATSTTTRATTTRAAASSKAAPEPTLVTAAGYDALKRELDDLVNVQRPEVIMRVKLARELGDLKENADYTAARNEQSFLEGRVQALEQMLKHAKVIDADHTGEVVLGSTVEVLVEGDASTFHIVGSTEADPGSGKISNASPVGRALMGHRAGDTVEIVTPARTLRYQIVDVRLTE